MSCPAQRDCSLKRRLCQASAFLTAILALSGSLTMPLARAQDYPFHPVRFIVPYPPGGGVDLVIRAVAQELTAKWHAPVIVENRAGAGGLIGTEAAYRAQPDGYTLLATVNQNITTAPFTNKSLRYDPSKLLPVTLLARSNNFILANPAVPANTLSELIEHIEKEPRKWAYGSFGRGSQPHLLFEYLNAKLGLDILNVPYSGISPLLIATLTGDVSLTAAGAGVAGELLRSGKLKALAIAGERRSPLFPDVPTTQEAGFGYLQSSIWYAVFAPPGTRPEIVEKIGRDVRSILREPRFANDQIVSKGLEPAEGTSEELAETIRKDIVALKVMIDAAKIEPE
jgi:tripartite-type tricarboxylate transporter receptor subunit TctC